MPSARWCALRHTATAFRSKSISETDRHRPTQLLEVATVGRAHGLNGEVALHSVTNRAERFAVGSRLWTDVGERFVARSRQDGTRWLVAFEGIADRTAAAALTGSTVYGEPIDDPDELWVHELIGCSVVDQHGYCAGAVVSVVANPAADLLELDTGHLVPSAFVVDVKDGTVYVEVPDGLFELVGS